MRTQKQLQASFFNLELPMTFPSNTEVSTRETREMITYQIAVVASYRFLVLALGNNFIFYVTLLKTGD